MKAELSTYGDYHLTVVVQTDLKSHALFSVTPEAWVELQEKIRLAMAEALQKAAANAAT